MDVLAGYHSSSSTEEDKIQRKLASEQVAKEEPNLSVAASMEKELESQADDSSPPTDQQEEKTEQKKELSCHSSKRRSSPSIRHRNYRKRSVSESPEKSPKRRSPENSPSSRKRSRNSDYRDDRRHHRRSRSRSRSRSPRRRRRRSPSPRNLIHMMDLGPEVNGHLTTLLWKVEKILENQERVLKNQERLLKLVEQQQATTGTVVSGERLVNGVRYTTTQEHPRTGECKVPSNLLESLAVLTSEAVGNTIRVSGRSSPSQKGSRASKKHSVFTKESEPNDSVQNSSVSVDESVDYQNVVSLGSKYSVSVSPSMTALNSGCVNCDSSNGSTEVQDETSSDSDRTKELLAWAERIQKTSCSIGNFSVNLVKVLFTKDEMSHRNCSGTRGKGALDSGKLDLVKFCAFKLYSVPEGEQDSVWKQKCVVSIDEYLRRGNRTRVQKVRESKDTVTEAPLDSSIVSVSVEVVDVQDDNNVTEELSQT